MGAGVSEGDWERVPQLLFDCDCECECECESFSLWIRVFPAGDHCARRVLAGLLSVSSGKISCGLTWWTPSVILVGEALKCICSHLTLRAAHQHIIQVGGTKRQHAPALALHTPCT